MLVFSFLLASLLAFAERDRSPLLSVYNSSGKSDPVADIIEVSRYEVGTGGIIDGHKEIIRYGQLGRLYIDLDGHHMSKRLSPQNAYGS